MTLRRLLLSGGIPTDYAFAREGYRFRAGVLVEVDVSRKTANIAYEYEPPPTVIGPRCSRLFKCAFQPSPSRLLVVSSTEFLDLRRSPEGWSLETRLSLPFFNDLHAVSLWNDELALVNTGTEEVLFFSYPGLDLRRRVSLAPQRTEAILALSPDLRQIPTTKPHPVHVNYAFRHDGSWWATRFHHRDATCLADSSRQIPIGVGNPHDGHVLGRYIFFTTTNGHIVRFDVENDATETFFVPSFTGGEGLIGWYRGILPVEDSLCWVALSRLRETKFKEYVRWFANKTAAPQSTLLLADLSRQAVIDTIPLAGQLERMAIFSVLPIPEAAE